MSNYKDILKKGWHPEKEGTTFKGQMKSLVGRGDSDARSRNHTARPITALQDPSTFGPPPIRRSTGTPSPPVSRPLSTTSPTSSHHPPSAAQHIATEEPVPPPKQYRVNTTGLCTSNLPPPPIRRDNTGNSAPTTSAAPAKPTPPRLPPRLPPRNTTPSSPAAAPSLPTRTESLTSPISLNQGAINRLGAAGISVPGLGIGRSSSTSAAEPVQAPALNELQSQFSRLGNSHSPSPPPAAPTQGTTLEQKRAALQTAAAFRQSPSSVSISDARAAASTANNFRQRHGDQVASGMRTAGSLYGKYGGHLNQQDSASESSVGQAVSAASMLSKKKPPPPPPPKKPQTFRSGESAGTPPPIPLTTRPQF
ncbi:hypothetical protein QBC34DRAFT_418978 [Podospora aff. communis PSN243]|uniref:Uncharacterized protein n=1 Tax=Podospora aff. communis PSN243 TaxID=3040156 RepID=A0AAV9FWR9_9PEZI|nr:hypothetical protein QBC34DRAFT_418978 [Podospora aff. communis PSN243]